MMEKPFKFLSPYHKEDKAIFFGREEETEELYQRVFRSNLILVYGPSGSGKTSLINCGLSNRFRNTDWFQVSIRRKQNLPLSIRKSIQNEIELAQKSKESKPIINEDTSIPKLIHKLYLKHFKPIYLIFDQFEELFILGDEEERKQVIQSFLEILESGENCSIIIVLREEFIAELDHFEIRIKDILTNRLRVEKMRKGQWKYVVQSILHAPGFQIQLIDADHTLNKILSNISRDGSLELAYLQVYLDRLFEEALKGDAKLITISPQTVDDTGKLANIMGIFLNEQITRILQKLKNDYPELEKDQIWHFLAVFVSVKGTKKPISSAQLDFQFPQFSKQLLNDLLKELYQSRIIRNDDDIYEIAHDSLASHIAQNVSLESKKIKEAESLIHERYTAWKLTGTLLSEKELNYLAYFENQLNLTPDLKTFLHQSRRSVQKKRVLFNIGTIVGILIISLSVFLLMRVNQSKRINNSLSLISKAQSQESLDPTKAFTFAKEATEIYENSFSQKVLSDIYRKHNFYDNLIAQSDQVITFAVSSDGQYIAYSLTGISAGRVLYLLDSNGQYIDSLKVVDNINDVFFSQNGETLLIGLDGSKAVVWLPNKQKTLQISMDNNIATADVSTVALSPNGHIGAIGTEKGKLYVYEFNLSDEFSYQLLYQNDSLESAITSIIYVNENQPLLFGRDNGIISLIDLANKSIENVKVGETSISSIIPLDSSKFGLISPKIFSIWDLKNNRISIPKYEWNNGKYRILAISSKNLNALTVTDNYEIQLWNNHPGKVDRYLGHIKDIQDLIFSDIENSFYSSSEDGSIKKWGLPYSMDVLSTRSSHKVRDLALSSNGENIFVGRATLEVIDLSGKLLFNNKLKSSKVTDICENNHIFLWGFSKYLWAGSIYADSSWLVSSDISVREAIFSPDCNRILKIPTRDKASLLDTEGNQIQIIPTNFNPRCGSFSEDGENIILGEDDGSVTFWDIDKLEVLESYKHENVVKICRISPDKNFIISADENDDIILFNLHNGVSQNLDGGSISSINDIAISKDSRWIGIAKDNGTINIWNNEGYLVREEQIDTIGISKILFHQDPRVLTIGQDDGIVMSIKMAPKINISTGNLY